MVGGSVCFAADGGRLEDLKSTEVHALVVMFVVVGTVALATMAVLIVAAGDSASKIKRYPQRLKITWKQCQRGVFSVILAYFVEILVSLLYGIPIVTTIFFQSLGCCGTVPYLGGRPQNARS
jgi:hypothetical protein